MKKILFVLLLTVLFIFTNQKIDASNYQVFWENDYINVEVNSDLNDYINRPKAILKLNGKELDCKVTYFKGVDFTTLLIVKTSYCEENKVIYQANFSVDERVFHTSKRDIYFNVVDTKKPEVIKNPNIEILLENIDHINYLQDLVVKDNYTALEHLNYSYDKNILKIGDNKLNYTVCDEKLNCTKFIRTITVMDLTKPKAFLLVDYLRISVNQTFDLNANIICEDNSNYFTVKIEEEIENDKIGVYEVKYIIEDKTHNKVELFMIVEVMDDILPTIILDDKSNIEYIDLKRLEEILRNGIIEAYDNYDELAIKDVKIIYYFDEHKFTTTFEVIYSLEDSSQNKEINKKIFEIKNIPKPTIVCNDLKIPINQPYNVLDEIKVVDFLNKDITNRINIKENNCNNQKIGLYKVIYHVTDEYQNEVIFSRYIELTNEATEKDKIENEPISTKFLGNISDLMKNYIIGILLLIVLGIAIKTIYYKYKLHK